MTHEGHRERLKKRFLASPDSFEDHEILELILFYCIPRKNTNETAHRLLERFGSLKGVLDASLEALVTVEDVGMNSAIYLKAISSLLSSYKYDEEESGSPLRTPATLCAFLHSLFVGTRKEVTYLILFDNSKKLLACEKISEGYSIENTVSLRKITSLSLSTNAVSAILAHNHPNGRAFPSGDDIHATNRIKLILETLGITLMEHFIVSDTECTPIINPQKACIFNARQEDSPEE